MVCSSSNLRRSTGYCYWLSPGDLCLLLLGHHRLAAIWYRMIWDETGRRYCAGRQRNKQLASNRIYLSAKIEVRIPVSSSSSSRFCKTHPNCISFRLSGERRRSGCSECWWDTWSLCSVNVSWVYSLIIILWVALKWLRDNNGLVHTESELQNSHSYLHSCHNNCESYLT